MFSRKEKYHKTKLFPKYLFFCPFCEYSKLLHGVEDHRKLIKYEKRGEDFFQFFFTLYKKDCIKNISVQTFTATFMPLQKNCSFGGKTKKKI